jgi:hypothetical protein
LSGKRDRDPAWVQDLERDSILPRPALSILRLYARAMAAA